MLLFHPPFLPHDPATATPSRCLERHCHTRTMLARRVACAAWCAAAVVTSKKQNTHVFELHTTPLYPLPLCSINHSCCPASDPPPADPPEGTPCRGHRPRPPRARPRARPPSPWPPAAPAAPTESRPACPRWPRRPGSVGVGGWWGVWVGERQGAAAGGHWPPHETGGVTHTDTHPGPAKREEGERVGGHAWQVPILEAKQNKNASVVSYEKTAENQRLPPPPPLPFQPRGATFCTP